MPPRRRSSLRLGGRDMPPRLSPLGIALAMLPLYAGPILSGWAHHPLEVVPVFALVFLGYLLITRRRLGVSGLALAGLIQLVLCGALQGGGLLLALMFGPLQMPLWPPLLISTLGAGAAGWLYRDLVPLEDQVDEMQAAVDRLATKLQELKDARDKDDNENSPRD